MRTIAVAHLMGMFFGFLYQSLHLKISDDTFTGFVAIETLVFAALFIDSSIGI